MTADTCSISRVYTFVGRRNTVAFSFDARGIEEGKSFKGHINIITDGGEYKIPYSVEVVPPYVLVEDKRIEEPVPVRDLRRRSTGM